ncbi:MAG TPA: hypothetical protein VK395_35770 [Gemmataceae bacterium]|nr:hypothetical protein [Gemmataceae bacterium]
MIDMIAGKHDDPAFVALAQRIVNGVIASLQTREVHLVHVDNWFDHKWLGWWSWREEELCVPPFNPNRVVTHQYFLWDPGESGWRSLEPPKPLHIQQAGRSSLAQPLNRISKRALFIWYSGNTATNDLGSLMVHLSGADRYAWYASFRKKQHWTIADECRITRRELVSFEERGRLIEQGLSGVVEEISAEAATATEKLHEPNPRTS